MKPGIHDVRRSRLSSVGEVGELEGKGRLESANNEAVNPFFKARRLTHYQRLLLHLSMAWRCDQS